MAVAPDTAVALRRGYQDYASWLSFGTRTLWDKCDSAPSCALEIFAQYLHKMLLKNPAERTSADVASAIAVVMFGPIGASLLTQGQATAFYEQFKVRQII
jgi:hypothetical protein